MITNNGHRPLNSLGRDPRFLLGLLAGPVVWAGLWVWYRPDVDLLRPLQAPLVFLLPVLVYAVLEELVFRGLLQGALRSRPAGRHVFLGISSANAVTSLAFAAAHVFYHPPLWAGLVFFPSLVFGYFRDRYERILPAIILHVFYNTGYFWLLAPRA